MGQQSAQITSINFNRYQVKRGAETIIATITIKNTGNVQTTYYVGSSGQSPSGTWYDFTLFRTAITLNAGSSGNVQVSWTPTLNNELGNYGFYTKVFKASSGTDYYDDDWWPEAFSVIEPTIGVQIKTINFNRSQVKRGAETITATITIKNTGDIQTTYYIGSSGQSSTGTWYDFTLFRTAITLNAGSSGNVQVSWAPTISADLGTYGFYTKVFKASSGTDYYIDDWRTSAFSVIEPTRSSEITAVSFDRSQVIRGSETITATLTIKNIGDIQTTYYIGSSGQSSAGTWYDFTPFRTTITLNAGSSDNVQVSWAPTITADLETYGFYTKVFKASSGTDYYVDDWRTSAFSVTKEAPTIKGRMAFHRDSNNSMTLHTPTSSDDGNIFIYDFSSRKTKNITGSLPVMNAMNPYFSPDGSKITFMGIPSGKPRIGTSLEIFVYDLAKQSFYQLTTNDVPDEDPKFSPDGTQIVFKRSNSSWSDGQIWLMNINGTGQKPLTNSTGEKSGPYFSPDGSHIAFWRGAGANEDIGLINADGSGENLIIETSNLQEYYPTFFDNQTLLYTRWESTDDRHDKIYAYWFATRTTGRLAINQTGVEDADPFPLSSEYIGFSSTRNSSWPDYDLFIGDITNGDVFPIENASSNIGELGGSFTPYTSSRELIVQTPKNLEQMYASSTYILTVTGFDNSNAWASISPKVEFEGPINIEYTGLHDDGKNGDTTANDGVYSKLITLPSQPGNYIVYSLANSNDNGITHEIKSPSLTVIIKSPLLSPPIAKSATNITSTGFTANWEHVDNATGYLIDVSADSNLNSYVSPYHNLGLGNVTSKNVNGLQENKTYYYRLRAYTSGDTSKNSNIISVSTIVEVLPPSSPLATTATNITSSGFTANWEHVDNAIGYLIDVSKDSMFTNYFNKYKNYNVGDTTSLNLLGFNSGTIYYYRLKAYNTKDTSSNSNSIKVITIPSIPVLASPSNDSNDVSTSPKLVWQNSIGADSYTLQVSTDSNFSSLIYNKNDIEDTSQQVPDLSNKTVYYWRVNAINISGTSPYSDVWTFITSAPTSVEQIKSERPTHFYLYQNYPNPFNPSTTIEFAIAKQGFVTLTIYNVLGVKIAVLLNDNLIPGYYRFIWSPSGNTPSGVYFYRLNSPEFKETKKLLLLR